MNVARWSRRCSGEEKGWKERDCCGSAAAGSGSDHLLALALGDGLDDGPLALDRRKRATVEIVDVRPDLQFPIIIDKRALIGQALHTQQVLTSIAAQLTRFWRRHDTFPAD
jgi:hypothetical protein